MAEDYIRRKQSEDRERLANAKERVVLDRYLHTPAHIAALESKLFDLKVKRSHARLTGRAEIQREIGLVELELAEARRGSRV